MSSTDLALQFVRANSVVLQPAVSGRWFNIQIQPDLATSERLNAGVGFVDESDRVHIQMSDSFEKLRCLYGENIDVASYLRLASYVSEGFSGQLLSDLILSELSPNLSITGTSFVSGSSIPDILSSVFLQTVTIARETNENFDLVVDHAAATGSRITTKQLRISIINALIGRLGVASAAYLRPQLYEIQDDSGVQRKIDLPIRKPGKFAGSIISLGLKGEDRRKVQLLEAGLDLETVRANSSGESLGLFLFRPSTDLGFTQSDLEKIDNEIDDIAWRLKRNANVEVEASESEATLTDTVEHFIQRAA